MSEKSEDKPDGEEFLLDALPITNPHLKGATSVDIAPAGLWHSVINNVWVVPGRLDWERWETALQRATAIWPTTVGRFVQKGPKHYAIDLTASPLPLVRLTIHQGAEAPAFPTHRVIQPSLDPYITPCSNETRDPGTDEPLLKVQVTEFTKSPQTVIGISWGHIVGDAAANNEFVRILSRLYADPDTVLNEEEYPTFEPHVIVPSDAPGEDVKDEWDCYVYRSWPRTGASNPVSRGMPSVIGKDPFFVELSNAEMEAFQNRANATLAKDDPPLRLSKQDCLSAWWMSLRERGASGLGDESMNEVGMVQLVNYRNLGGRIPGFPANLPTLSSNVFFMVEVKPPPQISGPESGTADAIFMRIVQIAKEIRKSLARLELEPSRTADGVCYFANHMTGITENRMMISVAPPSKYVYINSNLRYDWNHSFGFPPHQTSFHTFLASTKFLRTFQANPSPSSKPRKTGETSKMYSALAAEMSWATNPGEGPNVEKVVQADRDRWMR